MALATSRGTYIQNPSAWSEGYQALIRRGLGLKENFISMVRILYIGHAAREDTSRHRADALARLGYEVELADPYEALSNHLVGRVRGVLHYRTGYRLIQHLLSTWVETILLRYRVGCDLVWVDSGELLGPKCLKLLRSLGVPIVLYNHDDATGKRDGRRFDSLKNSLSLYDLSVVVRSVNVQEYKEFGAHNVMRVWRSYDEIMHRPYQSVSDIPARFRSEVAFIGTWMRHEERDQFLLGLIKRGIPISIWGHRWEKSAFWEQLKDHYRGGNLSGRDYVAAIQGAKVVLGLLSKGNRDLHTTRTMEVPYSGGVLCAERTIEHLELYKEDIEAVFWDDVDECAVQCRRLLDDNDWRELVRRNGMERVRALSLGHEQICRQIVELMLGTPAYEMSCATRTFTETAPITALK